MDSDDEILVNINNFYSDENGDAVVNDAYDQYLSRQSTTPNTRNIESNESPIDQDSDDVLLNNVYDQYEENVGIDRLMENSEENDGFDQLMFDAVSGYERDVRRINMEHDYTNVGKLN